MSEGRIGRADLAASGALRYLFKDGGAVGSEAPS
jgi:hypothetical protein